MVVGVEVSVVVVDVVVVVVVKKMIVVVVLIDGVGFNQVALVAECREGVFSILIRLLDAWQMLGHFLLAEVEFGTIVTLDPVDHFLLKPAVDVHTSPLLNILLHLPQAVGMHLAHPKLAQYLELLDLCAAALHEQEEEEIGVDVDDVVVDGWCEGWHFQQFVDDVDVLEDGSFCLEVVDRLSDQPHHPLLNARVRETEQPLHELSGLEDLDVPKVDLDVVQQFLQEISGVHPSNFKLYYTTRV